MVKPIHRQVFFVSDGTGITAETFGHSLLTQFDDIEFTTTTLPFIDNVEKAQETVLTINAVSAGGDPLPLVFTTLVNREVHSIIETSQSKHFDLMRTFLVPMEQELGKKSSFTMGRSHGLANYDTYKARIDAVNYALAHDDGIKTSGYDKADVILIGVSRCGKTPTSLYLALQFGVLCANFPFTVESSHESALPESLKRHRNKLFGLTINSDRLASIRSERRPNSEYASLQNCRREIEEIESLYRRHNIPYLNTTHFSIEEIASKILSIAGLKRAV